MPKDNASTYTILPLDRSDLNYWSVHFNSTAPVDTFVEKEQIKGNKLHAHGQTASALWTIYMYNIQQIHIYIYIYLYFFLLCSIAHPPILMLLIISHRDVHSLIGVGQKELHWSV